MTRGDIGREMMITGMRLIHLILMNERVGARAIGNAIVSETVREIGTEKETEIGIGSIESITPIGERL